LKPRDLVALLTLSALWGGSFLFIRVAAPILGPIVLIALRVFIAGAALFIYARIIGLDLEIRKRWKQYLLVGLLNSAIPFTLIATAELNLTAGLAAILNATSPLFGAIVAALWLKESLSTRKIIGMMLGLLGVSVLVGWSSISFTLVVGLSILASLVAATFYGIAGVYTKISSKGVKPIALATCSQLGASVFLIPLTPFALPASFPGWDVILSVLALSLVSTAIAYVLYFRLIENVGPTKALTVTFLAPVFGVLWGVLLLNEPLTLSTLVGFAIILSGTGLVTGLSFKKAKTMPYTPKHPA
jgi:drug/metabolite transporter (DMT)-like permease